MTKSKKKELKTKLKEFFYGFLQLILTAIVIYFLVKSALSSWDISKEILRSIKLFNILAAIVFSMSAFFLQGLVWEELLHLGGERKDSLSILYAFFTSLVARYVPGNIWSYLSKINSHKKLGIRRGKTIYFSMVEVFIYITSGIVLSLVSIAFWPDKRILFSQSPGVILIGALLLLVIVLSPWLWRIFFSYIVPKKELNFAEKFDFKKLLRLFYIYLLIWVLFGSSLYFIIYPAVGLSLPNYILAISISTIAVLIGFLSFVTPSGLGVREGVMAYLLRGLLGTGTSSVFAIIARLINILSEILIFLFIWVLNLYMKSSRKKIIPEENDSSLK